MPGELLQPIDAGFTYGRPLGGGTPTAPQGINWKSVLADIQSYSNRSPQTTQQQPGILQPAQLPGSTVPIQQLQIQPLNDQKQKQTDASSVAQYAQIIAALFGFGA